MPQPMPVAAFEQSVWFWRASLSDSGAPSFGMLRARASNASGSTCMTNFDSGRPSGRASSHESVCGLRGRRGPTCSSGAPPASPNAQFRCLTSATFSSSENGESTTAISFSASSAAA